MQDCNRLQALLSRKVTVEHIEAAAYLLSGLKIPANIDLNVIALNYSIALADALEHTLKQAVKDIICGKAKGLSKNLYANRSRACRVMLILNIVWWVSKSLN
ncbi:hypothetical protein [Bartonella sp. AP36NXGY]|uniref:hypothetical protein n=1 Tax=Bartonella sp. AP36NXGY TaxID=3243493 RepID=UPI0035D0958F